MLAGSGHSCDVDNMHVFYMFTHDYRVNLFSFWSIIIVEWSDSDILWLFSVQLENTKTQLMMSAFLFLIKKNVIWPNYQSLLIKGLGHPGSSCVVFQTLVLKLISIAHAYLVWSHQNKSGHFSVKECNCSNKKC